jgi:predicted aldo/keto reductase-like oxidoreductase
MSERFTRRQFIATTAAGTLAAALGMEAITGADEALLTGKNGIPQRVFGKTGVRVPTLGFGTAPAGELLDRTAAVALFNEAIDSGVTYMDTAPRHTGYGHAQEYLGYVLKERRKEVFLTTKCYEARGDEALKLLERNLKELQTDHADVVYAHSVGADSMDYETVTGQNGVLRALLKAKRDGLARFVGISGHCRPGRFVRILNEFDIDVMMTAVNFVDRHIYNFEDKVWPVAKAKNVGLAAMKVFGGPHGAAMRGMMPEEHLPVSVRYALGLPGAAIAVLGMNSREQLRQNVKLTQEYKPLTERERAKIDLIGPVLAREWGARFGKVE